MIVDLYGMINDSEMYDNVILVRSEALCDTPLGIFPCVMGSCKLYIEILSVISSCPLHDILHILGGLLLGLSVSLIGRTRCGA